MLTPEQILQLAQAIQPKLHTLLPADTAATIHNQLTDLMTQARQGKAVAGEIVQILSSQAALRSELENLTDTIDHSRKLDPLAGQPPLVPATSCFKCPHCDYTDVIPQSSMKPDPCPDHPDAELIPLPA